MTAIVLVKDAALASSLEAVLVADGLRVIVQDPQSPLQALPLAEGRLLVSEHRMLPFHLAEFLTAVGARSWGGLVILLTDDRARLVGSVEGLDGVTILEMPFVGTDLIDVIRSWTAPG